MGKQLEALKLAIKDELLATYRKLGARKGTLLPRAWLYEEFLPSLSAREEEAMAECLAGMIREGIIEYVPGPRPTYRLTAAGAAMLC